MSRPNEYRELSNELVSLLNQGDAAALTVIFNHYYPALCFFAQRLTGDKEEAKDIVARVFIIFWQKCADFADHKKIKAFLYLSVRNACYDFLRKLRSTNVSKKELLYLESKEELHSPAGREQLKAEIWQTIFAEIEALPSQIKAAFKMLYFDGLDTKAVSEKMNLPVQVVRNYKSRAIESLRKKNIQRRLVYYCSHCNNCCSDCRSYTLFTLPFRVIISK